MKQLFLLLFGFSYLGPLCMAQVHNLSEADSLHEVSKTFFREEDIQSAIAACEKALEIKRALLPANDPSIRISAGNLALFYYTFGRYYQAAQNYQLALNIREAETDSDDNLKARYHNGLGNCYHRLKLYEKANFHFQEVERQLLNIVERDNNAEILLAGAWNNMAVTLLKTGDFTQAEIYLNKAKELWKNYNDNHQLALLDYNFGDLYHEQRAFTIADVFYREALARWQNDTTYEGRNFYANCLERIGFNLQTKAFSMDVIDEQSIKYLEDALSIRQKYIPFDTSTLINSYHNLGIALRRIKRWPEAVFYFEKALDLDNQREFVKSPVSLKTFHELGHLYSQKRDFETAEEYHRKALGILKSHPSSISLDLGKAHLYLAEVLASQARWPEAGLNAETALNHFGFSEDYGQNITAPSRKNIILITQALSIRGIVRYQTGKQQDTPNALLSALEDFRLSAKCLEYIRNHFRATDDKRIVLRRSKNYFEDALKVCLELYYRTKHRRYLEEAFAFMEKARSQLLHEQWGKSRVEESGIIHLDLLQRIRIKQGQIADLEDQLENALKDDAPSYWDELNNALRKAMQSYLQLLDTLALQAPQYYRHQYESTISSTTEVKNNLLDKDQSLLEYFVGEDSLYIFSITQESLSIEVRPIDFPVAQTVREFKEGLIAYFEESVAQTDENFDLLLNQYIKNARFLFEKLIAPVEHLLTSRLVIVPDDILGYLPFELLLSAEPANKYNYQSYPYFLKNHSIIYNYSATMWSNVKAQEHPHTEWSLLAFAPYYTGTKSDLKKSLEENRQESYRRSFATLNKDPLRQLPHSGEEVSIVSSLWNGEYLVGKEVTVDTFLKLAPRARLLHLSTHSMADTVEGRSSRLFFANDSPLSVRKIFQTPINADLVILSSCASGSGEYWKGEGVISLAWAFTYAGAKSVANSLWFTEDRVSKEIFCSFHSELKHNHQPKDVALQQAKLHYLSNNPGQISHPFYWGAFINIGDASALGY